MFEKKLKPITEKMTEKFHEYDEKFDDISKYAKIAIGMSVGLSIVDTMLLVAILKKIS